MTYQTLLQSLQSLTPEQLLMDVTIFVDTEYYPIITLQITQESDVLDEKHPFLAV